MQDAEVSAQQEHRPVAERREQLIEAAIAVLAEHGLDGMTTRRITERAGLALGAFHYAFDSKHALMKAVIERFSDRIDRVLLDTLEDLPEPPPDLDELVDRVLDAFWSYIESTRALQIAQYELTIHALRNPELRELAEIQYERTARAVDLVLDELPPISAEHREDMARFFGATIDGLVLHHLVRGDPGPARRRLRIYRQMACEFLRAHTVPA